MNGLGLGLVAADSFFKEQQAQKVRDYEQAKRDAELSTLPDKTAADRSGYQLSDARNQAGARLLPQQTDNASARLGLESSDLAGQADRQPAELATKKAQAEIGLGTAQNDQANLPSSLQVKNNALQGQLMSSDAELKALPGKLQRAAVQGILDEKGQQDVVIGTLASIIEGQDKTRALQFANQIAQMPNVLPGTNGRKIADIVPVRSGQQIGKDQSGNPINAQGDGYLFVDDQGTGRLLPVETMRSAQAKLKSGDYQFIHTNDGSVFSGNKQTGAVSQVHQGDPKLLRGQHTPAEVQTMEWLMSKGVAKDANGAWDMVRSAREKSRGAFVSDYVTKMRQSDFTRDSAAIEKEANELYDRTHGPAAGKPPASGQTDWSKWMNIQ